MTGLKKQKQSNQYTAPKLPAKLPTESSINISAITTIPTNLKTNLFFLFIFLEMKSG